MSSADLRLPIDTAWLRANAPEGTTWRSKGFAKIPVVGAEWGSFELYVWRLRKGVRRIDLVANSEDRSLVACMYLFDVKSRRELIDTYESFGIDWYAPREPAEPKPTSTAPVSSDP
jgi:hypothetical protein